ncbi:hypothetical protein [Salimicrobium halophilum]|uniref:hypothetical protein n=1 Tax=Salimicrobium halophilum TaxID=86666 RepID=UPI000B881C32|nr:hypothetical protein [Salimicrobium halophilum]
MAIVIMTAMILLIIIVAFRFIMKGKTSAGEDYTPSSDMYSGKKRDYSTYAPKESHRQAPYEEVSNNHNQNS